MLEGAKAQFDVVADGEVLFSKQASHRFPEPGEATRLVRAR